MSNDFPYEKNITVLAASTWDERCGIATYTANLVKSLEDTPVRFEIANFRSNPEDHINKKYDIFTYLYVPTMPDDDWVQAVKRFKGPKVLEEHLTMPNNIIAVPYSGWEEEFDYVIVHQKQPKVVDSKFIYIPHGIPEYPGVSKPTGGLRIGTAGFPFRHKLIQEICAAASEIKGASLLLLMPESEHVDNNTSESKPLDAREQAKQCLDIVNGRIPVEVIHDFLPEEEVVMQLRGCDVAVFGSEYWAGGTGGAVLMGIAAKVPVVVPDVWHFKEISRFVYTISIDWFKRPSMLAQAIKRAAKERRDCWTRPLGLMGWSVVSRMYLKVYQEILISQEGA